MVGEEDPEEGFRGGYGQLEPSGILEVLTGCLLLYASPGKISDSCFVT